MNEDVNIILRPYNKYIVIIFILENNITFNQHYGTNFQRKYNIMLLNVF